MAIQGIDVSNGGQGTVNWDNVLKAGIVFAIAKVSQGTYFRDPSFSTNRVEAKRRGIYFGGYLYWDPTVDPKGQAALFASQYGKWTPGELPPMLDIEKDGWAGDGSHLTPAQLTQHALVVLQEMERLTGCKPGVYTYPDFWRVQMGNTSALDAYPLWIAGYPNVPNPMIGGWQSFVIHQYTDSGWIGPMKVDEDVFNGTLEQLKELCGLNSNENGPIVVNGFSLHDGFLGLWKKYGVEVMGLPLSDEYVVNEPSLGNIPVTYMDFENLIVQYYPGIEPRICAGIRKYKYGK